MSYLLLQDKKVTMIKTESGQWIPSTYKSGRYKEWQEKNKVQEQMDDDNSDQEDEAEAEKNKRKPQTYKFFLSINSNHMTSFWKIFPSFYTALNAHPNTHWGRHNQKVERKKRDVQLKPKDQILKKRLQREKEQKRIKMKQIKKSRRKKR